MENTEKKRSVAILQPTRGQISVRHLHALEALMRELGTSNENGGWGWDVTLYRASGCSLLCQARSELASTFLREGLADCLLWIDDDMVDFDGAALSGMCHAAIDRCGVVAAASMQRKPMGTVNFSLETKEPQTFFHGGGLVEASTVGTGLCAVAKNALAAIAEGLEQVRADVGTLPIWPFYERIKRGGYWFGEDTSFCLKASDKKIGIYVDTRVRVGHLGEYAYHLEDSAERIERFDQLIVNHSHEKKIGDVIND